MQRLASLMDDPASVAIVPVDDVPMLLGELESLRARLLLRLHPPAPLVAPGHDSGKLMSVQDVADKLNVKVPRVYELMRKEDFPVVRIGRQVRVAPAALDAWIAAGGAA